MIGFSSVIEIIDQSNSVLKNRTSNLSSAVGVGPPDLCMVIREHFPTGLKKLISKSYTRTYYHYIYGADTSSLASIAAYFRHFLDNSFQKSSNSRVIFGCFCTYDLFSKHDIRVEIHIPGNTSSHMVNSSGSKFKVTEDHWQGCYLSSGLRALYPIPGTAVAYTEVFKSFEDIERFFMVSMKFWGKLGFVLGDTRDTFKYGINLLLPALSKYLLRRKRYKLHQSLFKRVIDRDPLLLTFVAQSSFKIGRMDEIIKLLKSQIKITPHAFPLYYTAAKAYLKRGEVIEAIRLCQYLVELNLEVFEYWELLVQGYIKYKDYNSAILCFNHLPICLVKEVEKINVEEQDLVLPERISYSAAGNIWITPSDLDFRPFDDQVCAKSPKEKAILKKLDMLPGSHLTGSRLRAYRLLVKIEKNIEWDNMIKIKQSLLKKTSSSFCEEEKIATQHFSSLGIDGRSGFTRTVYQTFSQDFTPENNPSVDYTLQPAPGLTFRNYFLAEAGSNKLSLIMNPLSRSQSEGTTELFSSLYNDLKAVYEWQKENSDIQAVHALRNSKS